MTDGGLQFKTVTDFVNYAKKEAKSGMIPRILYTVEEKHQPKKVKILFGLILKLGENDVPFSLLMEKKERGPVRSRVSP